MTDDDFDQLLRGALDVEPQPAQLARLETFWRDQMRVDARRRNVRWLAAATILVAAAAWAGVASRRGLRTAPAPQSTEIAASPSGNDVMTAAESANAAQARRALTTTSPSAGRAPTVYERLAFAAAAPAAEQNGPIATIADIDAAIARLVAAPTKDVTKVAQETGRAIGLRDRRIARMLQSRFRRASQDERLAIIALAAGSGSVDFVPWLLKTAARPVLREASLSAVEAIAGAENVAAIARRADHPSVRVALMTRLLTSGSQQAVLQYLALVVDRTIRDEALSAAEAAQPLPLDALLAHLDDDDKAIRLAAAQVLGHVNGPEVSRALITRLSQPDQPTVEAWMALLACRGEAVDRFLRQAVYEPRFLPQVNNARAYWARMTP
jgi:hypothetical protein